MKMEESDGCEGMKEDLSLRSCSLGNVRPFHPFLGSLELFAFLTSRSDHGTILDTTKHIKAILSTFLRHDYSKVTRPRASEQNSLPNA